MKLKTAMLCAALVASSAAHAENLAQEFEEHVMRPCVKTIASKEHHRVAHTGITLDEFSDIVYIKVSSEDSVHELRTKTVKMVTGISEPVRLWAYKEIKIACTQGYFNEEPQPYDYSNN